MIDKRQFKSEPIQLIKDLVIEEVSLVDRPANPGAEVLVFKRLDLDANLLKYLDNMDEKLEGIKATAQNTVDIYDKLKIERMKMGTIVEKILAKAFGSQVEAMDELKLDLVKLAKADDSRSPERRLDDYLVSHPAVEIAIRELPTAAKVEVQETRDFGKAYAKIQKKIDELISNGDVSSRAKLFMKVVDSNPALLIEYYKDRI
jgi:hypothetical protein